MRTLSDGDFLDLWEKGVHRHPLDRALLTLVAAFPDTACESLADWTIGRRNQSLTKLYCQCFDPRLRAWTVCVNCGEKLEFEMNTQLLAGEGIEENNRMDERVTVNGLSFRLPTSRDLALAAGETDPAAGAIRIAESCLVGARPPAPWSEEELSAIGEKLAMADPLAEVRLTLHCPSCETDWQDSLDVAAFFWTEIEARVRQLLLAIHTLALAYGWSEAHILSMSENRRAIYLELARS
jgi:hypothetical protein